MKQRLILLLVLLWLLLSGLSWAQCPEEPLDLGYCDTLHIFPWSWTDTFYTYVSGGDTHCVNNPGDVFPCLFYVSLLITHDSNTFWWESEALWVQDSLAGFRIPLTWARTNPAAYCGLREDLNRADIWQTYFPTSIWRDFGGMQNRIKYMAWNHCAVPPCWRDAYADIQNEEPYHVFVEAIQDLPGRRWWEGERVLFATLTFLVEDTMTVCMDTTLWPPDKHLMFWRHDAQIYCPRDNMPLCFRIFETGDVNANGTVDVGDQVYLYNYLFMGTSPPIPYEAGDLTQDGIVEVGDLIYLVNYLFISGPLPPVTVISPEGS